MPIRDPSQPHRRLPQDALRYFTNREKAIEKLESYVDAPSEENLKVLVFYGVGGIGKTALQLKLCDQLRNNESSIPFARFNLENVGNKYQTYRDVLLNLRSDLERDFNINFFRFDLCWSVIVAHEGGDPEPLLKIGPMQKDIFNSVVSLLGPIDIESLTGLVDKIIHKYPSIEEKLRRVLNSDDVTRLRNIAKQDDSALPGELIRSFVNDLKENLPLREGKACRGILFLDTYESLWTAREGGASAQARLLDEWVRDLVEYCLHPSVGILPIICGRDRLQWTENDPQWQDELDQHLLGGLSTHDALVFLSRCGIGPAPDEGNITPLQESIIKCCLEQQKAHSSDEFACHPFYLALCAEIVQNTRDDQGNDPPASMFSNIPSAAVANELATRFFRSLNSRAMELWVSELSLTPHFDEEAALALDEERKHHNGRAGWERLKSFSFMDSQEDGSYRFHKIMKDVLRNKLRENDQLVIHEWFCNYWKNKDKNALSWYHNWLVDPDNVLSSWNEMHEDALKHLNIGKARELLSYWDETVLDEYVHGRVGDGLWAKTHMSIGNALVKTPQLTISQAIKTAIELYSETLKIFTETEFPMQWAMTKSNLGSAYIKLPTGDNGENIKNAIQCYEDTLRIYTETEFPIDWAITQNNLGAAYISLTTVDRGENLKNLIQYSEDELQIHTKTEFPMMWVHPYFNLRNTYVDLPTGNRDENLKNAIQYFEDALQVLTEIEYPMEWAITQISLGAAHIDLPTGNRGKNLKNAIQYCEAALRILTETEFPINWALTQNNLGIIYGNLPTGNRGKNLKNAIHCFEDALRIYTETEFPWDWAMTKNNLGNAYVKLPKGDRGENLKNAIQCYDDALRIYTETEFPWDWAMTKNNLGVVYENLTTGVHGENLKNAIQCYKDALRVRTKTEFPMDRAMTQKNLIRAYIKKGFDAK